MRLINLSILAVAGVFAASAGQIQLGGSQAVVGGNTISNTGLTAAYLGGSPTWLERNYVTNLFPSAVISGSSLNGVAETTAIGNGGAGTLPTAANGFQQFTDLNDQITFAMMSDGTNAGNGNTTNQFWASGAGATTGATSIVVPVNLSNLGGAYILLNDYWGVNGSVSQTDTVTFNFVSNGAVNFTLTNGNQISSATNCPVASPTDLTAPLCTTFAQSTSSANTDYAWTGSYANTTSTPSNPYSNTAGTAAHAGLGTVDLEDIHFNLGAYAGDTLTSITITDNNNISNASRLALSAVTLTTATPEPSTVFLMLAGLGGLALLGYRKKAQQQ